ncbi:MAG: DUF2971 domain-containing protein [bacterium]|nr:DUF2971 domain-containing protein [bacterium]
MQEIEQLSCELYADTPRGGLYHYTTFSGLLGIIGRRCLWASDIRYMNDSAELRHTADLFAEVTRGRMESGHADSHFLSQFVDWIKHRLTTGHLLFAASFRSHGNLLSQWRGYSLPGKGVSLGFCPDFILECARRQQFLMGKCIYEPRRQERIIHQVLDALEREVERRSRGREMTGEERNKLYQEIFTSVETDLLRIAAMLKHPSFSEEKEWRIVSPVVSGQGEGLPVLFREGHDMLVPYIEFSLSLDGQAPQLDHLYLGPSVNANISMNSIKMFLDKNGVQVQRGIDYCRIPYRRG